MNIIAIECSTNICSVASFRESCLVNVIESDEAFSHSKNLPLMFKSIASDFNDYKKDIDFFAISIGPGSFTSLRISLSFLKGLAFGLNSRIIPVPTLESLNFSAKHNSSKHYIVMDSYRDKCFIQEFKGETAVNPPYVESTSYLVNIKEELYGYSESIKSSNKIIPSATLIGKYAIENKSNLMQENNDNINPIYLSDNEYVKIDDTGSK